MAVGRGAIAFNHFPAIIGSLHARAQAVVLSAAGQIVMVAAASMEGQESPSAPGHAPAIDTGLLHDSLDSKMVDDLEAIAYTNVEYGPHLEFGTIFMDARPFMQPAAERVRKPYEQAMAAMLRGLR